MSARKKASAKAPARGKAPARDTRTTRNASAKARDTRTTRDVSASNAAARGRASAPPHHHPHASLLDELVQRATAVRDNAHAPYSRYRVGAAVATKSGRIFEGCNVENASFGATICAERGAIMQMIAAGERDPIACAVVTGDAEGASPCGICRQVLSEFAKDMPVVLVGLGSRDGAVGHVVQLADLLPLAFDGSSLR
ncbi:MAG: cytidine deaminase [Labilithrix sp.]|nr:cytidine deaminase [Labilithrix sp.]